MCEECCTSAKMCLFVHQKKYERILNYATFSVIFLPVHTFHILWKKMHNKFTFFFLNTSLCHSSHVNTILYNTQLKYFSFIIYVLTLLHFLRIHTSLIYVCSSISIHIFYSRIQPITVFRWEDHQHTSFYYYLWFS